MQHRPVASFSHEQHLVAQIIHLHQLPSFDIHSMHGEPRAAFGAVEIVRHNKELPMARLHQVLLKGLTLPSPPGTSSVRSHGNYITTGRDTEVRTVCNFQRLHLPLVIDATREPPWKV